MRPYLITAKLMRHANMKRFPTPGLASSVVTIVTSYLVWKKEKQLPGSSPINWGSVSRDSGVRDVVVPRPLKDRRRDPWLWGFPLLSRFILKLSAVIACSKWSVSTCSDLRKIRVVRSERWNVFHGVANKLDASEISSELEKCLRFHASWNNSGMHTLG
jgi:hypothetical protein